MTSVTDSHGSNPKVKPQAATKTDPYEGNTQTWQWFQERELPAHKDKSPRETAKQHCGDGESIMNVRGETKDNNMPNKNETPF